MSSKALRPPSSHAAGPLSKSLLIQTGRPFLFGHAFELDSKL